uniref:Uncharacterized protein n=1 Tax=Romanomermis culicivorax TaxID=13658 RepID=A0A915HQ56_ROMCU
MLMYGGQPTTTKIRLIHNKELAYAESDNKKHLPANIPGNIFSPQLGRLSVVNVFFGRRARIATEKARINAELAFIFIVAFFQNTLKHSLQEEKRMKA